MPDISDLPTAFRTPLAAALKSGAAPTERDAVKECGEAVSAFGLAHVEALGVPALLFLMQELCMFAADVYVGAVRCLTGGRPTEGAELIYLTADGTAPREADITPPMRAQMTAAELLAAHVLRDAARWAAAWQKASTGDLGDVLLAATWVLVASGAASAEHALAHHPDSMPEDVRELVRARQASQAMPDRLAESLAEEVSRRSGPGSTFVRL